MKRFSRNMYLAGPLFLSQLCLVSSSKSRNEFPIFQSRSTFRFIPAGNPDTKRSFHSFSLIPDSCRDLKLYGSWYSSICSSAISCNSVQPVWFSSLSSLPCIQLEIHGFSATFYFHIFLPLVLMTSSCTFCMTANHIIDSYLQKILYGNLPQEIIRQICPEDHPHRKVGTKVS